LGSAAIPSDLDNLQVSDLLFGFQPVSTPTGYVAANAGIDKPSIQPQATLPYVEKAKTPHDLDNLQVSELLFGPKPISTPADDLRTNLAPDKPTLRPQTAVADSGMSKIAPDLDSLQLSDLLFGVETGKTPDKQPLLNSGDDKPTLQPKNALTDVEKARIPHDLDNLQVSDLLFGLEPVNNPVNAVATDAQAAKSPLESQTQLAGTENAKIQDDVHNSSSATSQAAKPGRRSVITDEQLTTWASMSKAERNNAGGWKAWAETQNIDTAKARGYLADSGLGKRGKIRLSTEGKSITPEQVDIWRTMSQQQRHSEGGWVSWAQKQGIKLGSAIRFLNNHGTNNEVAVTFNKTGTKITSKQIDTWEALPQQQKHAAGGWRGWAEAQGIEITSARRWLNNSGINPYQKAMLSSEGRPITAEQLKQWENMPQVQKDKAGGWVAWTISQNIDMRTAKSRLTNSGLSTLGRAQLNTEGRPITVEHLKTWEAMTQKQREDAGGREAWALSQGLKLRNAAEHITDKGLTIKGEDKIAASNKGAKTAATAEKRRAFRAAERILSTQAQLKQQHDGLQITAVHLKTWGEMTRQQRDAVGGPMAWAKSQGIDPNSAKHTLTNRGLTYLGQDKLGLDALPKLMTWQQMTQEQRNDAGGARAWANSQSIYAPSAVRYLKDTGLTKAGVRFLSTATPVLDAAAQKVNEPSTSTSQGGRESNAPARPDATELLPFPDYSPYSLADYLLSPQPYSLRSDAALGQPTTSLATFGQRVIVNTDASNPVVNKAAQNLANKHPDTSVVIAPIGDGRVQVLSGVLVDGGSKKVEVVGHSAGLKLGGLDSKQISDVVQTLANGGDSRIDKLTLVGCGTACANDGPSLVNQVGAVLHMQGALTQVKGYDSPIAVDVQGHKQPTTAEAADALGKRAADIQQSADEASTPLNPKRRILQRYLAEHSTTPPPAANNALTMPAGYNLSPSSSLAEHAPGAWMEAQPPRDAEAPLASPSQPVTHSNGQMRPVSTGDAARAQRPVTQPVGNALSAVSTVSAPPKEHKRKTDRSSDSGENQPWKYEVLTEWRKTAVDPNDRADFWRYLKRENVPVTGASKLWNNYQATVSGKKPDPVKAAKAFMAARLKGESTANTSKFALEHGVPVRQFLVELRHVQDSLISQRLNPALKSVDEPARPTTTFDPTVDNATNSSGAASYKERREAAYAARESFDNWILQAPDVFDVNSPAFAMLNTDSELNNRYVEKYSREISKALDGRGPYLGALQFHMLSPDAPAFHDLTGFAEQTGLNRTTLSRWIRTDATWSLGSPQAHRKVAEQLHAKRPKLFSGFSEPNSFKQPAPLETVEAPRIESLQSKIDRILRNVPDVFDRSNVMREIVRATPENAKGGARKTYENITNALDGKGTYLAAMRYYNLSAEQAADVKLKAFAEQQGVKLHSLNKWILTSRAWIRGAEDVHQKVMLQLVEKRPDLLTLSPGMARLAGARAGEQHIPVVPASGQHLDTQPGDVNRPETPHARPSDSSSVASATGGMPPKTPEVVQVDLDSYINVNAPPLIPLEPDRDDSPPMVATATAPSNADSPPQSPDVVVMPSQQNAYFQPWIKTEPDSSPVPSPTPVPEPLEVDLAVKEEVPVLRHSIDNTVPILQGENGEDVLFAALQPVQKKWQAGSVKELLDRMTLTLGADVNEAIAAQAALAGAGNVRASTKKIKDDIAQQARWLTTVPGEERARYMESWMEVEDVPGMGRGIKAARDIPPFTVLAPYAGKYLKGDAAINAEWKKVGMNFTNYTFGTKSDNSLISAFGDGVGNISSLTNKGMDDAQNNLTAVRLGSTLLYLMALRAVPAGEALLYDYGDSYDYSGWPSHPIEVEHADHSDTEKGPE